MTVVAIASRKKSWQTGRERVRVEAALAIQRENVMQRLVRLRADIGHPEKPGEPLPQDQAAQRAGVTARQWQRWESGASVPYARNLSAVADAFGFDVVEFYDGPAGQRPADNGTPYPFPDVTQLDRIERGLQDIRTRLDALEEAILTNGNVVAERAVEQVRDLITEQPDEVVQAIEALAAELHADADRLEAERAAERGRRGAPRRPARAAS